MTRVTLRPAFGLAVITPLVFAGAVAATPSSPAGTLPLRNAAVTPLAAIARTTDRLSGPAVVAVRRPPASVHMAAAISAPPPAAAVYTPGMLGIPQVALSAYRATEQKMAAAVPGCGVSWNLLAGIGRIESMHANGGAADAHGTAVRPIYGPVLDGTLAGNEVIVASSAPGRVVFARAMGPMQFLPGTWSRYAADGDGDGLADPQNLYDASLAAARYLCSGDLNLRDQSQVLTAILRYNNSMAYASNVLGWAAAYATGVVPVDLPSIVGPAPPIGDRHLDHPEGLGPDSSLSVQGLPSVDQTSVISLIDLSKRGPAACTIICLESQAGPVRPLPPPDAPPAPLPPDAVPAAPPNAPPNAPPDAPTVAPPNAPPDTPPTSPAPPAPDAVPSAPGGPPPSPSG
ncbi:MAG: lytic murein transglycosylase [Mycobacterium sp.]